MKEDSTPGNNKDIIDVEATNHLNDNSFSEIAEFSDDEDDIPLGERSAKAGLLRRLVQLGVKGVCVMNI